MRVSGAGGEPEAITTPEESRHGWPEILPNGAGVLFSSSTGPAADSQIALLDLDTVTWEVIIPNGGSPQYSTTGHIVYGLEGTLRAVPFDLDAQVTNDPVPVLESVVTKGNGAASFALSETGSLVYVSGTAEGIGELRSFVWVDREGREEPLPLPPRTYLFPRLSPDGTRLAVGVGDADAVALWVYDVVSAAGLRLTQGSNILAPLWTPDAEHVVFTWNAEGSSNLYRIPADGSGEVEPLTMSDVSDVSTSVTPDGRAALFIRIDAGQREIWEVPLEGERTPTPVLQGEFQRGNADVSPDGRWMVYRSDQSGQMEIYLQPYPGPGPTVPVSIGGGDMATWSSDGSELFYRVENRMMGVRVNADGTVSTPTQYVRGQLSLSAKWSS